jgi:hypothetical protein
MRRFFSVRILALLAFVQGLTSVEDVQATNIQINLGSNGVRSSDWAASFTDLNGTLLSGQNLALDFTFNANQFVRLFSATTSFEVLLTLRTNSSGLPGFLSGTGFLIDQHGNPLQPPQDIGAASSSNGSMFAGLFPLFPDSGAPNRPFDFFNVHFDLTLPDNSSVQITGGKFGLGANSTPFGFGPGIPANIVPDGGSTLLLFGPGLVGLILARKRFR